MCGLYGFVLRSNKQINVNGLTKGLAIAAQSRGSHATGIAYNSKGSLCVVKAAKPADKFVFDVPVGVRVVTGHTRHTTQGSEQKNYNNHPFIGTTHKSNFALSHNGVLDNDYELRHDFGLVKTDIETDSYVAVQMMELFAAEDDYLTLDAIVSASEQVQGMFAFSILDDKDDFWIVRNDSPIYIVYYKKLNLYVYGSTEQIVKAGLRSAGLGDNYSVMKVEEGRILHINHEGKAFIYNFNPQKRSWYNPKYAIANGGTWSTTTSHYARDSFRTTYTSDITELVDELMEEGLTYLEADYITQVHSYTRIVTAINKREVKDLLFDTLRDFFDEKQERVVGYTSPLHKF